MEASQTHARSLYKLGGITTAVALIGIITDIVIGSITGGNLDALPQTALARFQQFSANPWFGLYNMDLLNIINQLILIPAYFALYLVHKKINSPYALLALIVFCAGTVLMVANNTALPMMDLSKKFVAATDENQKMLLLAAGEAMLAKGSHGSLGACIGFLLPNIAGIMISCVMIEGKVFSKTTGWLGVIGGALLTVYVVLVTSVPGIQSAATLFAAPGGLLTLAWMMLFMVKFFRLSQSPITE
jgi:hypothetical protein